MKWIQKTAKENKQKLVTIKSINKKLFEDH